MFGARIVTMDLIPKSSFKQQKPYQN